MLNRKCLLSFKNLEPSIPCSQATSWSFHCCTQLWSPFPRAGGWNYSCHKVGWGLKGWVPIRVMSPLETFKEICLQLVRNRQCPVEWYGNTSVCLEGRAAVFIFWHNRHGDEDVIYVGFGALALAGSLLGIFIPKDANCPPSASFNVCGVGCSACHPSSPAPGSDG